MTNIRHLGKLVRILVCVLPLLVFLGGMIHVHPQAGAEFRRFCRATQHDACQFGQRFLSNCGR